MLLYIHIPFCDSKCYYCAFNSYVDKFHLKQEYMQKLLIQLKFEFSRFNIKNNSIETLFIGGGTPSTVAPKLYEPLFQLLNPYFKKDIEITTEANPNSATQEWLEGMFALGVNRVSFGVQSFNSEKLKKLNRAHNAKEAKTAIINAQKVGFKNISLDLIYATQGDTKELLRKDIFEAFSLPINHISAYALTIEEGTVFEKKPTMSQEKLELTKWLFSAIEEQGFTQYEISNFGQYQSKHNLGYWKYKEYIGLGSGAVGKLKNKRFYPTSSIEDYIQNPLEIKEETLSEEDIVTEKIFLGLRSLVGVDFKLLSLKQQEYANILLSEGKLLQKEGKLFNENFLLADELALFIMQ